MVLSMAAKWVDNTIYFGPDRRRRPAKRLLDRRRHDESGDAPPLAATLRRLRVRINGPTANDRQQALVMIEAAIGEASRLGWRHCVRALENAHDALRGSGPEGAPAADAYVLEAMAHCGAGR